jgi:hypothetical protein
VPLAVSDAGFDPGILGAARRQKNPVTALLSPGFFVDRLLDEKNRDLYHCCPKQPKQGDSPLDLMRVSDVNALDSLTSSPD